MRGAGAGMGVGMLRGRGIPLIENTQVSKLDHFKYVVYFTPLVDLFKHYIYWLH